MKKWFGRILKISFFLAAFLAIILTVLVNMGGNSDNLRLAVQDYLTSASGYRAEIETLNEMTFFPNIRIDIAGIHLHKDGDKIAEGRIDHALVEMGTWDVIRRSKSIKNIQISNISFMPGTLNPQPVTIDTIGMDETPDGRTFLGIKGAIGTHDLNAELTMESIGKAFMIGENSDLEITIGDIDMRGILRPRNLGGFHIRDFELNHNRAPVFSGAFSILRDRETGLILRGDAKSAQYRTETELDFTMDAAKDLSGGLEAFVFDMADFTSGSRAMNALSAWTDILALDGAPIDLDMELNAQTFIDNGQAESNAALILKRENGVLSVLKQEIGVPAR